MVFQTTYIHYYTVKFAHMNGHWKAYDILAKSCQLQPSLHVIIGNIYPFIPVSISDEFCRENVSPGSLIFSSNGVEIFVWGCRTLQLKGQVSNRSEGRAIQIRFRFRTVLVATRKYFKKQNSGFCQNCNRRPSSDRSCAQTLQYHIYY